MNNGAEAVTEQGMSERGGRERTLTMPKVPAGGLYAVYVLIVLTLVSVLNYADRLILGVLVEDIKTDLHLTDADVGFLGGAAFAVFYAIFGMALANLADIWHRMRLISIGVATWSILTCLSGLARGFLPFAACRFGVGVGESCATPASLSVLYDYFPPKVRTTVVGILMTGGAIGAGLGITLGGHILEGWNQYYPNSELAPLGLKGWQAAFIIVGLPGLLLAIWVSTLREPQRGKYDGIISTRHPHSFRETANVLLGMIPIANFVLLIKSQNGRRAIVINISILGTVIIGSYTLIYLTHDVLQWGAMGMGIYSAISWAQLLQIRDRAAFDMIFRCPTIGLLLLGMACIFCMMGIFFWTIPFLHRYHNASLSEIGTVLGIGTMIAGIFGVLFGGLLADKLRSRTNKGKIYVLCGGMTGAWLSYLIMLTAESLDIAYAAAIFFYLSFNIAQPPLLSTLNDLALPRTRATISAFFVMIVTLIGVGLSPYIIGKISDGINASGVASGDALRLAMMWSLIGPVVGLVLVYLANQHIESDELGLKSRALALADEPL